MKMYSFYLINILGNRGFTLIVKYLNISIYNNNCHNDSWLMNRYVHIFIFN